MRLRRTERGPVRRPSLAKQCNPQSRRLSGSLSARNRKFADSPPEGGGFELPVPGFRSSILRRSGAWNRKGPGSHSRVLTTDTSIFLPSRAHGGGKRIGPPKSPLGRGDHVARITWHSHPTTGGVLSSCLGLRFGGVIYGPTVATFASPSLSARSS